MLTNVESVNMVRSIDSSQTQSLEPHRMDYLYFQSCKNPAFSQNKFMQAHVLKWWDSFKCKQLPRTHLPTIKWFF